MNNQSIKELLAVAKTLGFTSDELIQKAVEWENKAALAETVEYYQSCKDSAERCRAAAKEMK